MRTPLQRSTRITTTNGPGHAKKLPLQDNRKDETVGGCLISYVYLKMYDLCTWDEMRTLLLLVVGNFVLRLIWYILLHWKHHVRSAVNREPFVFGSHRRISLSTSRFFFFCQFPWFVLSLRRKYIMYYFWNLILFILSHSLLVLYFSFFS
jgi:hypothetical protein